VLQHFAKHAETSTKLPRPHVIKAISRLRQLHDVETIRVAIVALDEIQVSFTLEAVNPGGYLWRVLSNQIKDRADRPAKELTNEGKKYAKDIAAYFAKEWAANTSNPIPASDHLIANVERAMLNSEIDAVGVYIQYAMEQNAEYFCSQTFEKGLATFLKQLPEWIYKYHNEFPDEPPPYDPKS
jgi:DhnA family fructose-bisphosphate aldolase class Ia